MKNIKELDDFIDNNMAYEVSIDRLSKERLEQMKESLTTSLKDAMTESDNNITVYRYYKNLIMQKDLCRINSDICSESINLLCNILGY